MYSNPNDHEEYRNELMAAAIRRDKFPFEISASISKDGEIQSTLCPQLEIKATARQLLDARGILYGDFKSAIIRITPDELTGLACSGTDALMTVKFDNEEFEAYLSTGWIDDISFTLEIDGDRNIATLRFKSFRGIESITLTQENDGEYYVAVFKDGPKDEPEEK